MRFAIYGSITGLTGDAAGIHAIVGSHGGRFTGEYALSAGVASLICHDAGIGLQEAGVEGLQLLNRRGIPAAATDYRSARIGDAEDMLSRGLISHSNHAARGLGVTPGQSVSEAASIFQNSNVSAGGQTNAGSSGITEHRTTLPALGDASASLIPVVIVDSASMICEKDRGAMVVTGSHGGLPGASEKSAIKADVFCAVFNDAGVGIDNAGIGRLVVLDERGIAAVAVDVWSARIGNGRSSYETGIISHTNSSAERLGARPSMAIREFVSYILAKRNGEKDNYV